MKYYFIGIKGSGMSSLASLLSDLGNTIIGYDDYKDHKFTEDELIKREIKIYNDNSYNLTNEIIVYSPAINENHQELVKAKEKKLKIYKYNELLGELTKQYKTICVSGAHGKTTTTAMLSFVLDGIIGCNYLIGDSQSSFDKKNDYFIIEACEYKRHFLLYDAYMTIITNIELDHTDYYKDLDDLQSAYQQLVNNTKNFKILCGDDSNIKSLNVDDKVIYYGFNENNDIVAKDINYQNGYTNFKVYINNNFYDNFEISLVGNHMILNTLAVIGVCYKLNIDKEELKKQLKKFKGAKRRFQEEDVFGTILIDDYAHHPKEISMSIKASKEKYKDKKIIALFMPNTYSRVASFYQEFAKSLNEADYVYLYDIAKGREKGTDFKGISSNLILKSLKNGEMINLGEEEKLLIHKGDVLLFMSCQNIYVAKDNLKKLILKR